MRMMIPGESKRYAACGDAAGSWLVAARRVVQRDTLFA